MIGQFCLQFSVKYLSDRKKKIKLRKIYQCTDKRTKTDELWKVKTLAGKMKHDFFSFSPIFRKIKKNAELFHRIVKAVKKFGMVMNSQKVYEFYIRTYSARILVPTNQPSRPELQFQTFYIEQLWFGWAAKVKQQMGRHLST